LTSNATSPAPEEVLRQRKGLHATPTRRIAPEELRDLPKEITQLASNRCPVPISAPSKDVANGRSILRESKMCEQTFAHMGRDLVWGSIERLGNLVVNPIPYLCIGSVGCILKQAEK